jgi:general secretion pathway protein B
MSILLEALKKSEQQRQLGQTPTLQTSVEGQLNSHLTLNHWIPLSMMALSVCVMGWFGLQQFSQLVLEDTPVVEAAITQNAVEPEPRTMTESFQPNEELLEEPAEAPPMVSNEKEVEKARLNQSFSEFTADGDQPNAETPARDLAEVEEPLPIPIAESNENKTRSGSSRIKPPVSEPISYWELPQSVRDDLPEIRITVLVYAENSKDRFLLSNGQRMVEKDDMGDGLVLEKIRRDGAVFLYRKYRFLVKG